MQYFFMLLFNVSIYIYIYLYCAADIILAHFFLTKGEASQGCSKFWAWISFARRGACHGHSTRLHHRLNGLSIVEADGSLVFLEANRDPSWVIDGGAKKVRRDTFPQNLMQQFARRFSELEWSMGTNLV